MKVPKLIMTFGLAFIGLPIDILLPLPSRSITVLNQVPQRLRTEQPKNQQISLGRTKRRVAGGKKGACQGTPDAERLTAIVTEAGDDITSKDLPTFLFFIPDTAQPSLKGKFRLQANNQNVKPPVEVTPKGTPGIIKVQFPAKLEQNKPYAWSLEISCGLGRSESVNGTVIYKVASPVLAEKLKRRNLSKQEASELYRREGFMLDAVAVLADDSAAKQNWQKLLQDLELSALLDK